MGGVGYLSSAVLHRTAQPILAPIKYLLETRDEWAPLAPSRREDTLSLIDLLMIVLLGTTVLSFFDRRDAETEALEALSDED